VTALPVANRFSAVSIVEISLSPKVEEVPFMIHILRLRGQRQAAPACSQASCAAGAAVEVISARSMTRHVRGGGWDEWH
jgi:hypothetical protein